MTCSNKICSIVVTERGGGRVQLWRGVHVREAGTDPAEGVENADGRRADAVRRFQLHGRLVLVHRKKRSPSAPARSSRACMMDVMLSLINLFCAERWFSRRMFHSRRRSCRHCDEHFEKSDILVAKHIAYCIWRQSLPHNTKPCLTKQNTLAHQLWDRRSDSCFPIRTMML